MTVNDYFLKVMENDRSFMIVVIKNTDYLRSLPFVTYNKRFFKRRSQKHYELVNGSKVLIVTGEADLRGYSPDYILLLHPLNKQNFDYKKTFPFHTDKIVEVKE
jgi:hypothetical protein